MLSTLDSTPLKEAPRQQQTKAAQLGFTGIRLYRQRKTRPQRASNEAAAQMHALRANEDRYPETDKRILEGTRSAMNVRDQYALCSAVREIWGRLNANAQEGLNERVCKSTDCARTRTRNDTRKVGAWRGRCPRLVHEVPKRSD